MPNIRRHARTLVAAAGLLTATFAAAPSGTSRSAPKAACDGKERWLVKTLQDDDADQVAIDDPKTITIKELIAKQRGDAWATANDNPRLQDELEVYKIRGKMTFVNSQSDGDIHIVISDGQNPKNEVIVEIVNPKCANVKNSDFIDEFRKVMNDWLNKFQHKAAHLDKTFEVTGVLFHDKRNHGHGGGPEGVELHPVLKIRKIGN